jgi:hypothetical protein
VLTDIGEEEGEGDGEDGYGCVQDEEAYNRIGLLGDAFVNVLDEGLIHDHGSGSDWVWRMSGSCGTI